MSQQASNPEGNGGFGDHPDHINKRGAPLKHTSWSAILKRLGDEIVKDDEGNPILRREIICRALYEKAQEDPRYAMTIMDREEGKPEQRQIITGDAFEPLTILHVHKTTDNTDGKTGDSLGSTDEKPDT